MPALIDPTTIIVVSRAERGGHPRYCAELAAALARRGSSVTLLEPIAAFESTASILDTVVGHEAIPAPDVGWARQELAIARHLWKQRRADATVLFQDTSPVRVLTLFMVKMLTSLTPISMVHNTSAHLSSRRERLKQAAAMVTLAIPHRVLVHNERQRTELLGTPTCRCTRIDVVPHGVWSTEIDLTDSADRDHDRVLMFGVMRDNSGLDRLKQLAPSLHEEFPRLKVSVVGKAASTTIAAVLDALAAEPNIDVHNEFVADDEVVDYFARASFVLIPYNDDYSSESGVLMQAISHGVPVITAGETSVADRVKYFGLGPAPTASLLHQFRVALNCTNTQYEAWVENTQAAKSALNWDDHATIILTDAGRAERSGVFADTPVSGTE